jgi:hypothetical protein
MINEMVVRAARGDQILGLTPRWIIISVVDDVSVDSEAQ